MTRITSCVNIKGGVGKTTMNSFLAQALLERGHKVLAIDLEYPGRYTEFFAPDLKNGNDHAVMALFTEDEPIEPIKVSETLDIFPTSYKLGQVDQMSYDAVFFFKERLNSIANDYDFVVIDGPPLLNQRVDSELVACTDIFSPVVPEPFSLTGLDAFLDRIHKIRSRINPRLPRAPYIFWNLYRGTDPDHALAVEKMPDYFDEKLILNGVLKTRSCVSRSISDHQAVWNYTKDSEIRKEFKSMFSQICDVLEQNNG